MHNIIKHCTIVLVLISLVLASHGRRTQIGGIRFYSSAEVRESRSSRRAAGAFAPRPPVVGAGRGGSPVVRKSGSDAVRWGPPRVTIAGGTASSGSRWAERQEPINRITVTRWALPSMLHLAADLAAAGPLPRAAARFLLESPVGAGGPQPAPRSQASMSVTDLSSSSEYDVIVVGSGIGGLSAGALAGRYGNRVLVCEAHSIPGGAAHSFERSGYTFDSGPSLWSGLATPSSNPLRQVLDAIGESLEWKQYDKWVMYTEKGEFMATVGDPQAWQLTMARMGNGDATVAQWQRLLEFIEPLQRAVLAVPPLALRADLGAVLTVWPYLGAMADPRIGLRAYLLEGPWSAVLQAADVTDPFLLNWFDFLAFAFSGLPSNGTVAAAMIYMLAELNLPGAKMDYPVGGSGALVDALVRGVHRYNGEVRLNTAVTELLVEEGRCVGVRLKNGEVVRARVAVISNAPIWQTSALLPSTVRAKVREKLLPAGVRSGRPLDEETPTTPSFVHLHLGIRAEGLSDDALRSIHHISVPNWEQLTAPQSAAFISIPSLIDPSLAPAGHHVIHAYVPATEPYELWAGLDRASVEYKELKRKRAAPLYAAIEKFIPDVRERTEVELIGSPLTHERFLRRFRGTYGPELPAGERNFPGAKTQIDGLLMCGDSTWPGIGVPAVAGSGIAAVHAFVDVDSQKELLDDLRSKGVLT